MAEQIFQCPCIFDTWLKAFTSTSAPNDTLLKLGSTSMTEGYFISLKFDISSLPVGTFVSAWIDLQCISVDPLSPTGGTIDLLTYDMAKDPDISLNYNNLGDYINNTVSAADTQRNSEAGSGMLIYVDEIMSHILSTGINHGFWLTHNGRYLGGFIGNFASMEYSDPSYRPVLYVKMDALTSNNMTFPNITSTGTFNAPTLSAGKNGGMAFPQIAGEASIRAMTFSATKNGVMGFPSILGNGTIQTFRMTGINKNDGLIEFTWCGLSGTLASPVMAAIQRIYDSFDFEIEFEHENTLEITF